MANEYLQRTPTSVGNRRVFTWSSWTKNHKLAQSGTGQDIYFCAAGQSTLFYRSRIGKYIQTNGNDFGFNQTEATDYQVTSSALQRDFSNWVHYLVAVNTTADIAEERIKIYINGCLQNNLVASSFVPQNLQTFINGLTKQGIGVDYQDGTNPSHYTKCNFTDIFFIDGQALTPEVFGYHKDGHGYISAGSSTATNFKNGQWLPKQPKIIIDEINASGGFGVNGFYLPMNSSNNFGADFHCPPNTILKLKENLPQPKAEIDGVGDYTGAVREELGGLPFAGVTKFDGNGDYLSVSSSDFAFGTGDFTLEFWFYDTSTTSSVRRWITSTLGVFGSSTFVIREQNGSIGYRQSSSTVTYSKSNTSWSHIAYTRRSGIEYVFVNGILLGSASSTSNYTDTTLYIGGYYNVNNGEYTQGFISNLRVLKGQALYTSNFTPPKYKLEKIPNTVLLCCNSSTNVLNEETGKTITKNGDAYATASELTDALVLAIPFVSGGLQNGFGDYSNLIRNSGTPKTITNSNTIITTLPSYYGSASSFNGSSSYLVSDANVSDLNMGSGDYTVETWVRFNELAATKYRRFFSIGGQASEGLCWELVTGTNVLSAISMVGGNYNQITTSFVPVLNQWYHIAQVKRSGVHSLYVDGGCVGIDADSGGAVNFTTSTRLVLGAWERTSGIDDRFTSMSMQDFRIYKGIAKYTGGFDVPRPYTPVGISTWRAVADTTANNFATLNPLITRVASGTAYPLIFTDGNLTATANATADSGNSCGIAVTSGKWYSEYRINTNNTSGSYKFSISVNPADKHWGIGNGGDQTGSIHFRPANAQLSSVSGVTFSTIYTLNYTIEIGDIIGVSLDMDNRQVSFYKNGTLITQSGGAAAFPYSFSGINSTSPYGFGLDIQGTGANQLTLNFGQNPTFSGNTTAGTFTDSNGKGLFKYQPPTGFLALCEDNLPAPTIKDPGDHFKTILYTGDGVGGRSIDGVGFKPDLIWIKDRSNGSYNHLLVDSVRGAEFAIRSSSTIAETSSGIIKFSNDGFSTTADIGYNANGSNHVAWCWKAGNTTQTNTSGSITSTVSVNQTAGFSIVSFTMTSGSQTIGHGLGRTPKFIITKQRDGSYGWWTYHESIGQSYVDLSSANAAASLTWGGTNNSSIFYINTSYAVSGQRVVAYCWAEIEGFSKFGSYIGNGSTDGPFVYCGFKPAWIMIKNASNTGDWLILDSSRNSTNPAQRLLFPNATSAELDNTNYPIDFLSNGFKVMAVSSAQAANSSGSTYIFAAFAESPFQTANAK